MMPGEFTGAGDASFRDLFERNPVPMFIYAQEDLRLLEGNDAAARQYGYTREQFLAMRLPDLLLPGDAWRLAQGERTPHTGGFAKIGVKRHMRADGSVIFTEIERLDLPYRGVQAALITAMDVTQRILATQQLQHLQEQLAMAQRLAKVGSFERDLKTGEVLWSEESYRIMGRDPATPAPTREELLRIVHPDDRAAYEAGMAVSERGADPDPVEYRILRSDGGIRWIHTVVKTICDERGTPWKRVGTVQDVTELHQAQDRREAQDQRLKHLTEELVRQKEHLAAAQKISRTGSIDRDLATGEVVWSDEARRLFGLAADAIVPVKDRFLALFHPDDRARFAAFVAAAERGANLPPIECRVALADGSVRWLRNVSETMYDSLARPVRRIDTFQDVSDVHAAQERQLDLERSLRDAIAAAEQARRDVEAANLELEGRVEERTIELRRAQMELVTKERLSALGQLTATVAHEMRNPLSAIRNTIFAVDQMGRAQGLALERPLARMTRSIARCEHIISDLLDFTRAREPKLAAVALDDWVAELLDEQTVPEGVVLERDLRAGGLVLPLDGDRFRRVLINLIENAVQAFPDGGGERRITVSTAAAPVPEIRVADTGPGIAPDVLPKIFEPLFSTKSFGTGLGLPTVKQIVEQHGGRIAVESAPGQGTIIRVCLPPPEDFDIPAPLAAAS